MSDEKKKRPRSFKAALAAWAEHEQAVRDDPTTERLDSLVTLLDVMDGEIVRSWEKPGHDWRRGVFSECRASARKANALVASTLLRRAQERGRAAVAARQAKAEDAA